MPPRALLDDVSELIVFVRVVEAGSFSAAARALGTTTSAISKRIAALERKLKTRLLHRTTRRLSATDAGRLLDERARRILAELADAEREIVGLGDELRGVVRVSAPVTFGQLHVSAVIADFLIANPELRVELTLSDRFVDIVGEDFDVAIRSGQLLDSSLVARKLAPDRRVLCAAPAYLERHGTPRTPADLARHNCLRHAYNNASGIWVLEGPKGTVEVKVQGTLHVNHGDAIRQAVRRGLGIGLLPQFVVDADLRSGALRPVLEAWRPPAGAIYALSPAGASTSRKVRALVDYLAAELPTRLSLGTT